MNISGVLVRSRPENIEAVRERLEQIEGVEVHGANPDGRLVVTVEQAGDRAMADTVVKMQDLPGVISASMIYHEYDDSEQITGSEEA